MLLDRHTGEVVQKDVYAWWYKWTDVLLSLVFHLLRYFYLFTFTLLSFCITCIMPFTLRPGPRAGQEGLPSQVHGADGPLPGTHRLVVFSIWVQQTYGRYQHRVSVSVSPWSRGVSSLLWLLSASSRHESRLADTAAARQRVASWALLLFCTVIRIGRRRITGSQAFSRQAAATNQSRTNLCHP
jgi:hypothetical protein